MTTAATAIVWLCVALGLLSCSGCGDPSGGDPSGELGQVVGDLAARDLADAPDSAQGDDGSMAPIFVGEATYYDADGTGACGFTASTDFHVAAMNGKQYQKALCGQCVEVRGPNGMVTVRIVDLCPGCKMGDLDLSMTAFMALAPLSAGRVPISWSFVPCP